MSTGIRAAGDEQFSYVTIMAAGLIRTTTGDVIGRSECVFASPFATRVELEADRKKIVEAYEVALQGQESGLPDVPAASEETASSEAVTEQPDLPPPNL